MSLLGLTENPTIPNKDAASRRKAALRDKLVTRGSTANTTRPTGEPAVPKSPDSEADSTSGIFNEL